MNRTLLIATLLLPLSAQAFSLAWPLACTAGKDCFVQNYVDRDPGAGMQDYTCGWSVYENAHDGTDIRLRDLAAMRKGVAVMAAAAGTVKAARDGKEDRLGNGTHDPAHEDCGNAVVIEHADGYETLYCHMRKGSIAVKEGQQVKTGDTIGQVGLSGFTNYPHLHFTLRKDKAVLDPFDSMPASSACNSHHPSVLWLHPPAYHPTVLLNDGFADRSPDKGAMRDTPLSLTEVKADTAILSYWVDMMGLRGGDVLAMRVTAPDGSVLVEHTRTIDKPSPFYFSFIGKRNHGALAAGTYHASMTLMRDGSVVASGSRDITVD